MDNQNLSIERNQQSDDLSNDLDVIEASSLAATGNLDEAEALLCRGGSVSGSSSALDILARIAVQKGQFVQARRLWLMVLEKDPTYEWAKAALARLDSPWLFFALTKRIAYLAGVSILLCLAAIGFMILLLSNYLPEIKTFSPPPRMLLPSVHDQPKNIIIPKSAKNKNAELQIRSTPSLISISGCSILRNEIETRIVFNEGLFTYRCEFTESAKDRLTSVVQVLAANAAGCWIIVEGHTDSDPMSANSPYNDNYELGFSRASIVAERLRSEHGINAEQLLVSSAGDTNPPYPQEKIKNRTVVIRLIPYGLNNGNTGGGL